MKFFFFIYLFMFASILYTRVLGTRKMRAKIWSLENVAVNFKWAKGSLKSKRENKKIMEKKNTRKRNDMRFVFVYRAFVFDCKAPAHIKYIGRRRAEILDLIVVVVAVLLLSKLVHCSINVIICMNMNIERLNIHHLFFVHSSKNEL